MSPGPDAASRPVPAEGPPWDLPISETPFAFVDLEMTGLDPVNDRVVEVCIHRVVGGALVDSFAVLVNPRERVGGASFVHGIDAAVLEGAPSFETVLPDVLRLLEGAIFVAHGAQWDVRFLVAEAKRAGCELAIPFYIDTLTLSRRAFAFASHALSALCHELGIAHPNAHRAEADVVALRAVFERCVETLTPTSARDLWQVRVGEKRVRDSVLEAARSAVEGGGLVEVTFRPSRRPVQTSVMVLTDVLAHLDPPVVVGYESETRSRKTLRADRIVGIVPYGVPSGGDPG